MSDGIIKAPPRALVGRWKPAKPGTAAHARAELRRTRQELLARVDQLTQVVPPRWRQAVKERPLLVIGGAIAVGWLLGQLTRRR